MTKDQLKTTIKTIILKLGKFPTIKETSQELNLPEYKVQQYYQYLTRDGFLIRSGGSYRLSDDQVGTLINFAQKPPQNEALAPYSKDKDPKSELPSIVPPASPPPQDWPLLVVRWVMLILGGLAAIISTWNVSVGFMAFLPGLLATILALVVVLFSVFSFEAIILLFQEHGQARKNTPGSKGYLLAGAGMGIFWAIALVVSVLTTLSGQYEQSTQVEAARTQQGASIKTSQGEDIRLKKEEGEIQADIKKIETLQAPVTQYLTTLLTPEAQKAAGNTYWQALSKDKDFTKKLDELKKKLDVVRDKQRTLESKDSTLLVAKESIDFYSWVATAFSWDPGTFKFWSHVFPTVFMDVVSPVGLAVFFFLRRSRKTPIIKGGENDN